MTVEQADLDNIVITCMILLSGTPITALIDFCPTHSLSLDHLCLDWVLHR